MMSWKVMKKWINRAISVFEYLVAGYLVLAGGLTMVIQPDPAVTNFMRVLYGTRTGVIIVGLVIVISGLVLMIGKIRKSKRQHGRGLFCTYLCFFFAAILNAVAYAGDPTVWVSNAVMALIIGALWLRWRLKTEYINPRQFRGRRLPPLSS
jgi:intracellular septation protein A